MVCKSIWIGYGYIFWEVVTHLDNIMWCLNFFWRVLLQIFAWHILPSTFLFFCKHALSTRFSARLPGIVLHKTYKNEHHWCSFFCVITKQVLNSHLWFLSHLLSCHRMLLSCLPRSIQFGSVVFKVEIKWVNKYANDFWLTIRIESIILLYSKWQMFLTHKISIQWMRLHLEHSRFDTSRNRRTSRNKFRL